MEEAKHPSRKVTVDIDQIREIPRIANRRASAFIRFGLDGLDERDGGDFALDGGIAYNFWPSEVTQDQRKQAREEFRSWLIGSCLRELDLFYGIFLDKVWFALEAADLHGTSIPFDYTFDSKFARDSNVANKQKRIAERLEIESYFEELNSLSLARNSLAHHAGIVRAPVDCNNDTRDRLVVKWLAMEMIARRGDTEHVVVDLPLDTHSLPGEGEIQLVASFVNHTLEIPGGQKLSFTHHQLAELCLFYDIMAGKTTGALIAMLRAEGKVAEKNVGDENN